MRTTALSLVAAAALTLTAVSADEAQKPKADLKGNMTVVYADPADVGSFGAMFTEGTLYGRLRMNNFWYDYQDDAAGNDHQITGLGGSVVYKSARYATLAATVGAYYTHGGLLNKTDAADIGDLKAGKDVLSRYNVKHDNEYYMAVIAQAAIDTQIAKTNISVGRQLFESVFTASNDTKMIPNSFDGIVVENRDISGTTLRAAHFVAQKLRDHTENHDVITFKDSDGDSWGNNDDSAVHKGLSYANFTAAGKETDHTLSIFTAKSKFGENLKTEVSYFMLPEVVNSLVLEANYAIQAGETTITPGIRYYQQMDDGGGAIANGLNLAGKTMTGYSAASWTSLDSAMTAVRVDIQPSKAYKFRLGYSAIADEADLVAPWRGFPTGGYTRAMAQYNWYANTKSTMARVDVDLEKLGLLERTKFFVRYVVQDFDDAKTGVQADTTVIHTDWSYNLPLDASLLQLKYRMALVEGEAKGAAVDNSYNEYRFEVNYLF